MGSSESKAKGSFDQKEFDISNMGELSLKAQLGNQSIHPVAYFYK
jgi:hypothetical protein